MPSRTKKAPTAAVPVDHDGSKAVANKQSESVLGITLERWQVAAGAIAIIAPTASGILYLSGKANFNGYLAGWGLPEGLFVPSTTEILYTGYLAETRFLTFFFALWAPAVSLSVVAIVIAVFAAVIRLTRMIRVRISPRLARPKSQATGESKAAPENDQNQIEFRMFRFSDAIISYSIYGLFAISSAGILALLGLWYLTSEQWDAGRKSAQDTMVKFDKADVEGCDPTGCSTPPLLNITYSEGSETREIEARVIRCSPDWCAFWSKGGEVVVIPSKSMQSLRHIRTVRPPSGDSSTQPTSPGRPTAEDAPSA